MRNNTTGTRTRCSSCTDCCVCTLTTTTAATFIIHTHRRRWCPRSRSSSSWTTHWCCRRSYCCCWRCCTLIIHTIITTETMIISRHTIHHVSIGGRMELQFVFVCTLLYVGDSWIWIEIKMSVNLLITVLLFFQKNCYRYRYYIIDDGVPLVNKPNHATAIVNKCILQPTSTCILRSVLVCHTLNFQSIDSRIR